jgi:hypothetical protein
LWGWWWTFGFTELISDSVGGRYVTPVVRKLGIFLGSSISMFKVYVM